ncbi:AAA-like domain-containing protein [Nostoc sp.]|uniref:AAA-like domain-containing protein n=1 Tax=Nostoc sp. TaxID=1180 RepID=UPI002FF5AA5A
MQLQSKNHLRRRGATLTDQGSRKLNHAKAEIEIEQKFKRYTLEDLSEQTGLTPNTLSKVFNGSVGVDKRTLKCCFDAFNLTLLKDDYLYLEPDEDNFAEIGSISPAETCCPIEPTYDSRSNVGQTHKMDRSQDNLYPLPATPPGGQMPLDSAFYIDRPMLESFCYEAIQQPGASINIRAPKQMGKTSLMTRILPYSETLGDRTDRTVSVNLQLANDEILHH